MPDLHCHNHKDRSRFSHSHSHPCNYSYCSSSQHEHCKNHSRSPCRYSHHSSSCNRSSSSHCYHRNTPYTRSSCTATLPGTIADPGITPNTTTTNQPRGSSSTAYEHHPKNMRTRDRNLNKFSLTILSQIITVWRKVKATQRMI